MISFEKQDLNTISSSFEIVNTVFVHFLEEGIWYISLLSDTQDLIKFSLKTEFQGKKNLFLFKRKFNLN